MRLTIFLSMQPRGANSDRLHFADMALAAHIVRSTHGAFRVVSGNLLVIWFVASFMKVFMIVFLAAARSEDPTLEFSAIR